jgi:hypothetical protein
MKQRFNINGITEFEGRDGSTKKSYTKLGTAFLNETKDGGHVLNIELDFFPTNPNTDIVGFTPKAKDDDGPLVED